ncbi:YciI family protein [Elioraea rosea]|uniref:YciI family protein n=1 Tax=Elioraea rosea TaxID=2492390 RepID=UPI001EF6FED4|nr:YciI family protein [Elioraea rosea]
MALALLAFDGSDSGAAARRSAARQAHLDLITAMAEDGRLALGAPLFDNAGRIVGSLMVLSGDDPSVVDAYLAAEPFATEGVWVRHEVHPFRIAALPYRPLTVPGAPPPAERTHTVIVAWDGRDDGALDRRLAVREAHFARVRPHAESGMLAFGGAILDDAGKMVGSIAVIRAADDGSARSWMADDPYVSGDVWRDVTLYGTRFAGLPYRPLPGAA